MLTPNGEYASSPGADDGVRVVHAGAREFQASEAVLLEAIGVAFWGAWGATRGYPGGCGWHETPSDDRELYRQVIRHLLQHPEMAFTVEDVIGFAGQALKNAGQGEFVADEWTETSYSLLQAMTMCVRQWPQFANVAEQIETGRRFRLGGAYFQKSHDIDGSEGLESQILD